MQCEQKESTGQGAARHRPYRMITPADQSYRGVGQAARKTRAMNAPPWSDAIDEASVLAGDARAVAIVPALLQ